MAGDRGGLRRAASMRARTWAILWAGRLSMTTKSPALSVRDQALLQPGQKDVAIHRPVEDIGRCDSVVAEARHEGCRLPMAVGRPSDQPFAAFCNARAGGSSPCSFRSRR